MKPNIMVMVMAMGAGGFKITATEGFCTQLEGEDDERLCSPIYFRQIIHHIRCLYHQIKIYKYLFNKPKFQVVLGRYPYIKQKYTLK